ncbi:MAG TPA: site-2 protease family protein [Candidatus Dormibacteraeota bacterium]|nr:site-2 protease family protein [Candidatus Dormibacteraeota bacterium]
MFPDPISLIYIILALILALTLHEFAHAWTSDYLGDSTARSQGRLTLNPKAHIDPFMTLLLPLALIIAGSPVIFGAAKPVPFNPWAVRYGKWGAALVAFAGPLTNLLLAIFFAAWLAFVPIVQELIPLFIMMISVNVAFFVFNMIPIPPLDGSRILYAVAPSGLRRVMDSLEQSGLIIIFLLLLVASPVIMPLISGVVGAIMQILVPGLTGLTG